MRTQQHVPGMRRELADMDDESRAVGKEGVGHHRHIRPAFVQRAEGGDFLGLQQFAEWLGVGGVHRWDYGALTHVKRSAMDIHALRVRARIGSPSQTNLRTGMSLF